MLPGPAPTTLTSSIVKPWVYAYMGLTVIRHSGKRYVVAHSQLRAVSCRREIYNDIAIASIQDLI